VFWSWIANDAGWFINWNQVLGATNDEASRVAAETRDLTLLTKMFAEITYPLSKT
jgi:cell filamentation protein